MKRTLAVGCVIALLAMLISGCAAKAASSPTTTTTGTTTSATSQTESTESATETTTTTVSTTSTSHTTVPPSATVTTKTSTTTTTTAPTQEDTTTTTTKSKYTVTSFATQLLQEEFHTEITMTLDKAVYALDETVAVTIHNNTGRTWYFPRYFYVLEQLEGGQWHVIPALYYLFEDVYLSPDKLYPIYPYKVNLTLYDLSPGTSYKLAIEAGDQWIAADFMTDTRPTTAKPTTIETTALATVTSSKASYKPTTST